MLGKAFYEPLPSSAHYDKSDVTVCPQTHFQCPGDGYCLPVFVLCNDMYDCPGHEDEMHCEQFKCPGFYRCRGSHVCLHPDHVCDGFPHCKQHDDEWFCSNTCPTNCTCLELSFHCSEEFSSESFPEMRYLDASDSGLRPRRLRNNTMLVFLALQHCDLIALSLPPLPNLIILDVSYNLIPTLTTDMLKHVNHLKVLLLTSNPLTEVFEGHRSSESPTLHKIQAVNVISSLTVLNLSQSGLQRVTGSLPTPQLQTLDVTGCDLHHLSRHWLTPLSLLHSVHTDLPTLCCPQNLPADYNLQNCHSPSLLLSSCHNLLGSPALRAVTALLAAVTLLSSGLNLFFLLRGDHKRSSGTAFVSHLSTSNLLMGVYLLGVCVADQVYWGEYLWVDRWWRYSPWCSLCSFLYLFCVQVSALILVSLTVGHCVHLARPDLQVWGKTQVVTSTVLCWAVGFILSITLHLFPWTLHHQTSMCVPFPLTSTLGAHDLGLHAVIILNTLLMALTMAGQVYIYVIVLANPIVFLVNSQRSHQLDSARRTIPISVADACGWFLVDVLVLLMPTLNVMPEEVRSAGTAFVLPFKMAINPVLYVLNVALERRRHIQLQRVMQRLGNKVKDR